jgi:hypothetical protein
MESLPHKTELTRADVLSMEDFGKVRATKRRELVEIKKNRRVSVGPFATFYFENYDTMWWQVHEMLWIEKGGEDQISDELSAYSPLIPKGRELVATVMFEIDNAQQRKAVLSRLGGVEDSMFLQFAGETVKGVPEADVDRTTADGKASGVQFVHFPFTPGQIEKFRQSATQVVLGIGHEHYGHMAVMPESVRTALATDFTP